MHVHSAQENSRTTQPLPLAEGENVLASFLVDLDAKLHFCQGELTLSNRRILYRAAPQAAVDSWSLRTGLHLKHHDHAGVGTLELHDAQQRVAHWHFTLDQHSAALRLVEQFERLQAAPHPDHAHADDDAGVCPTMSRDEIAKAESDPNHRLKLMVGQRRDQRRDLRLDLATLLIHPALQLVLTGSAARQKCRRSRAHTDQGQAPKDSGTRHGLAFFASSRDLRWASISFGSR